jgi:hypothetical protein
VRFFKICYLPARFARRGITYYLHTSVSTNFFENVVLLVLLEYFISNRMHIYLICDICIYFKIPPIVLHQQLKTLQAQLEPLLDLDILEEFHCW